MDTDIHIYLEYSRRGVRGGDKYWSTFGGQFHPGRDYELFGIIAGLRTFEDTKHIPLRGVPDDIGWETSDDW